MAFITVASIVNGQTSTETTGETLPVSTTNQLLVLWPLYTGIIAVVASFWLGEVREKHMLRKRGLLVPKQA